MNNQAKSFLWACQLLNTSMPKWDGRASIHWPTKATQHIDALRLTHSQLNKAEAVHLDFESMFQADKDAATIQVLNWISGNISTHQQGKKNKALHRNIVLVPQRALGAFRKQQFRPWLFSMRICVRSLPLTARTKRLVKSPRKDISLPSMRPELFKLCWTPSHHVMAAIATNPRRSSTTVKVKWMHTIAQTQRPSCMLCALSCTQTRSAISFTCRLIDLALSQKAKHAKLNIYNVRIKWSSSVTSPGETSLDLRSRSWAADLRWRRLPSDPDAPAPGPGRRKPLRILLPRPAYDKHQSTQSQ